MARRPYAKGTPWYDLRRWGLLAWAGAVTAVIIVVAVIVVPVLLVTRRNSSADPFPNYAKLNYSIHETCKPGVSMFNLQGRGRLIISFNASRPNKTLF